MFRIQEMATYNHQTHRRHYYHNSQRQNSLTNMQTINDAKGFLFPLYSVNLLVYIRYKYIFKHQLIYVFLLIKVCGKVGLWQCILLLYLSAILYPFFKPTISYVILLFHIGFPFYGKGWQKLLVLRV